MLFKDPLAVNNGQVVSGILRFKANDKFSYFIDMEAKLDNTGPVQFSTRNVINLHDQMYSYLYGSQAETQAQTQGS
jgi:hypothetical protein